MRKRSFWVILPFMMMGVAPLMTACDDGEEPKEEEVVTVEPSIIFSESEVSFSASENSAQMTYSLKNAGQGYKLAAASEADWLSDFDVTTKGILLFTVAANPETTPREATVTLTCTTADGTKGEASFTVKQEAKAEEAFELTIGDVGSSWAQFEVLPKDKSMSYMLSYLPAETMEGYVSDEALFNDEMSQLQQIADLYGMSLSEVLSIFLVKGDMTDQVFINMDPETEYYAYCYGVTAENTLATPITKVKITTAAAAPVNNTISITATDVKSRSITIDVTPSTFDTYVLAYGEKSVIDQMSDAELKAELSKESFETSAGNQLSLVYNNLTPDTEYVFLAMGRAGLTPTTDIQKTTIRTKAAEASTATFEITETKQWNAKELNDAYDGKIFQDDPSLAQMAAFGIKLNFSGEGFLINAFDKGEIDQVEQEYGPLPDDEYIGILTSTGSLDSEPILWGFPYNYDVLVVGVGYDSNGNYTKVVKLPVNLKASDDADPSEFESFFGISLSMSRAIHAALSPKVWNSSSLSNVSVSPRAKLMQLSPVGKTISNPKVLAK